MVLQIDAKRSGVTKWECYIDGGRQKTGIDVFEWINEGIDRGAGEILLTSVDREGTRKGMDIELISRVTKDYDVPVIASGGVGDVTHLFEVIENTFCSGVAMADILHYGRSSIAELRSELLTKNYNVRKILR